MEGELPPREALREALTLDRNAFWLGYFGQLDPTRGVEDLFAAVAALRASHDVRLVMIGSAGRPERYRAEAASSAYLTAMLELPRRLGIEDAVRRTDYLPDADVLGYLRAIDVCVLPYRRNHIGRSALAAALELGAPTVLAGSAAAVAPLIPGRNIALVPPGSPDVLARTLEGILEDDEARDRLRAGALAGAEYFSWPSIGERAESIYQERRRVNRIKGPLLRAYLLWHYRRAAVRRLRPAIRYLVRGRETTNFTYEVANLDELAESLWPLSASRVTPSTAGWRRWRPTSGSSSCSARVLPVDATVRTSPCSAAGSAGTASCGTPDLPSWSRRDPRRPRHGAAPPCAGAERERWRRRHAALIRHRPRQRVARAGAAPIPPRAPRRRRSRHARTGAFRPPRGCLRPRQPAHVQARALRARARSRAR